MHQPIQLKTKIQSRAWALQITFSVALIFASTILLAAARVQSVHAALSESSVAPKPTDAPVEFSTSRERVAGREIAGFSARQARMAQERNLTSPAGLKPVEQEAWLAMARRQGASGGDELASFYPKRYGEPFVVEGEGVRVALRPVGGTDVAAEIDDNGQVIYRQAYAETDSVHVVSAGRSEEFLFRQNECAPREFEYELSELSAGTRVELVNGEVRFTNEAGHGVKIEAPWLIETSGRQPAEAVRWELAQSESGARPGLRLVVAQGLRYPVLIDPSWVTTGSLVAGRDFHTATLLPSGKVLVAGGNGSGGFLTSAELYDPATGSWSSTGSLVGNARQDHTATLLPSGKVLVAGGYDGLSLSSAELYDPATASWSSTSSLATARRWHTATLLPSGQVLVAGGFGNSGALSSAELYDPATGSWSSTGSLATARSLHTGTLLPSGQVLVAGGKGSSGILSSAELYESAIVSQITPVGTTCSQFSSGTAENLGSLQYDVNNGLIGRVLPRSFLYWVKVTAPAGNNIFGIAQTITTGNFNTFFASNGNGSNVFDSNCVSLQRSVRQSGNTVTVRFNAPAAGSYFIAIEFSAQSLNGEPAPSPTTVHYDFTTTGVPDSTSGLDLVQH